MTTPNYDNFSTQYDGQGAGGAGAGAPPQQDPAMGGQMPDNGQGQFQGGAGGDPGSAGGQPQGTDAKTTLWYVSNPSHFYCPAMCLLDMEWTTPSLCFPYCHLWDCHHIGLPPQENSNPTESLTDFLGWESSNHGLMRTLFEACGTTWVSKSTSR